jgi:hypothetical protein
MKGICHWGIRAHQIRKILSVHVFALASVIGAFAEDEMPPGLRVSSVQSNGWVRISGRGMANAVVTLEASSHLVHWQTVAVLHDGYPYDDESWFTFADPVSAHLPRRFYRFRQTELTPEHNSKNQVNSNDAFIAVDQGSWIKFTILLDDPTRVYYADGSEYLFHYDFATTELEPMRGVSYEEFQQIALFNNQRQVVIGAVIFAPPNVAEEYGVQFVSEDPLPRALVRDLFHLVRSTVITPTWEPAEHFPDGSFYIPTFEQRPAAEADRQWFEANGVRIASLDRWWRVNTIYSPGWALGTLKFFSADEIDAAYGDGRLLPTDILVTDAVPAELPYVAGIITLSAATPNSHVAILARSHGVPFVHLVDQSLRARALELVGREVVLRLMSPEVDILLLDPPLDPSLQAELLAMKGTPEINIMPIQRLGAYTAPVDDLTPADIRFFGGKAANYGLLRRTIPSNSPPAIAISFDLWQEFMAQTLGNGKTLREEISNRLAAYTYPQRIPAIKTTLATIRSMIRNETRFTPQQEQAIIAALRVFDSRRNIRFRSSTNVEDTETFSGAGLYDSYSGCLDDDLDSDTDGPSHCDPTEDDERGVFRAIRRVYASFYNDNAYFERFRRNVDEQLVGMAILVHHSTPDQFELANGVATVEDPSEAFEFEEVYAFKANLVSELGAVSVANPDPDTPTSGEVVSASRVLPGDELRLDHWQSSGLVPVGDYVMTWESDYRQLGELLNRVSTAYRAMTGKDRVSLNFEYKKVQPGHLEVKQVRETPSGDPAYFGGSYLLDEPVTFVPRHSINTGLFQCHRMKSRWTFRTTSRRVNDTNMVPVYSQLTIEHLNGDRVETFTAPLNDCQCWPMTSRAGSVQVQFYAEFPSSALLLLRDMQLSVYATHQQPQTYARTGGSGFATTNRDVIRLIMDKPPQPEDRRYEQTYTITHSTFPGPAIFQVAYQLNAASELVGTLQTRIEGLTTQPIVLTNFYSQTLGLLHMGYERHFLFEPRLEPGLSDTTRNELAARNIGLIYVRAYRSASAVVWP